MHGDYAANTRKAVEHIHTYIIYMHVPFIYMLINFNIFEHILIHLNTFKYILIHFNPFYYIYTYIHDNMYIHTHIQRCAWSCEGKDSPMNFPRFGRIIGKVLKASFGLMFLGLGEFVNEYLLESKRDTTYLDEFSQAWKNHWQGPGAQPHGLMFLGLGDFVNQYLLEIQAGHQPIRMNFPRLETFGKVLEPRASFWSDVSGPFYASYEPTACTHQTLWHKQQEPPTAPQPHRGTYHG